MLINAEKNGYNEPFFSYFGALPRIMSKSRFKFS